MREWLSGRASPCQGERREFESRLPLQIRTVILIQNCGSVFLPEKPEISAFFKKKSFRVMDGLLKSEHFQPVYTLAVYSEAFP